MKYTIINATYQKDYETKYGEMSQYLVEVRDEHGTTVAAKHSIKKGNQVRLNQEGEGQVEDTEFGIKFKWLNTGRPSFGGNYVPKINRGMALQCACTLEKDQEKVLALAERFNAWIENKETPVAQPAPATNNTDEVSLDDLNF